MTEIVGLSTGHRVYVERHVYDPSWETVILVNGALSTTESFRQTVKYMRLQFNVLLYDLPFFGKSREHNPPDGVLEKDGEVHILDELISRYRPEHIASISWGGLSALLALAKRPPSVRTATVASFSPLLNPAMRAYIHGAQTFLEAGDHAAAAELLNETVGKHLPRVLKLTNHRYLSTLAESQYKQMVFHIRQMLTLPVATYMELIRRIDIPVLFLNGALDLYTTASDTLALRDVVPNSKFATVANAGHFLDMENRRVWADVKHIVLNFMTDPKGELAETSPGDDVEDAALELVAS